MTQKEIHSTNSADYKSIQLVPTRPEKVNEAEIWLKFKDGDEEAFIWIYRTYFETLYNYAGQFDLDFDLVKDQIQELFIYIRKRRAQLADVKSIKFYLFKSLRRRLLAYKKQRFSFLSLFSVESKKFFNIEIVDSSEVKLINQSLDDEIIERLSNSIDKLTARQKEAVMHFYYEGMSYQEIADIMDFRQVKSVRKLIYRAIDTLRKDLNDIKNKRYN